MEHVKAITARAIVDLKRPTMRSTFSLLGVTVLTVLTIAVAAAFAPVGNAAAGHFSQNQVISYVKTVASEIELTNNRGPNLGTSAGSKLYCHPTVYGQGVRGGNDGLYVWVTCSAMRKLEVRASQSSTPMCTGFSAPLWIEASAKSVSYRAISSKSEYIAYRSSAPTEVQAALDATYFQIYGENFFGTANTKKTSAPKFASLTSCK